MGNIVILDENTANKIAAGEVVERPASVVKELCENSIDAKATSITVEINNGGISLIKIIDNGTGIQGDDVEIAFEKHATSKIRKVEDLNSISSMGFRGEALSSISAVSKLELTTKTLNENTGTKIKIEGGVLKEKEECGCPKGTTVIVKDLFFNTPARYKFLKKDYTEAGYVEDVVTMLALGNPNISFKLIINASLVLQTPGNGEMLTTAYSIYGNNAKSTIGVDYEQDGIHITGLAGKPEIARSNRSHQIFFINNRVVKNRTMSSAVEEAYKTLMQVGKYPFVILNLEINPELVDVNVHPTKQEVRFSEEGKIFSSIFHAVKNSLFSGESLIPDYSLMKIEEPWQKEKMPEKSSGFPLKSGLKQQDYGKNFEGGNSYGFHDNASKYPKYLQGTFSEIKEEQEFYRTFKIVGSAFLTYILVEDGADMYIIDQHAAHERIMYEKLKKDHEEGKQVSQMLLIPEVLEIKHKEYELLKNNADIIESLGIAIEDFGSGSIKINSLPFLCDKDNAKEIVLELIDQLAENQKENKKNKKDKLLYMLACKSAVKANSALSDQEIAALIESMNGLENPYTCPHGRPTIIRMTKYEIEKRFGRA